MNRADHIARQQRSKVHPTGTVPKDGTPSAKPANQQASAGVSGAMGSGAKVVPTTAFTSSDLHFSNQRAYQGASEIPPPMTGRVEEASLRCELKEHDGTNRSSVGSAGGRNTVWEERSFHGTMHEEESLIPYNSSAQRRSLEGTAHFQGQLQISSAQRSEQFIAAFITTTDQNRIVELEEKIRTASPDELLHFTTELNTAVEYLLDPENHIQITDEAVFQRIGSIFESAVRRRLEIFHSNHILNSEIVQQASSTPLVAVLKGKFGLSSESAEKLKQVRRNLEEVFAKLKENQLIRQEREKTLRDAGALQTALQWESRDVAEMQVSAASASASAQRSKFDFTIDGQSGNDFKTACQPTADDVYDQCLFYFHNAFFKATKGDSSSRAYLQVLGDLTRVLKERKKVETEQPNVSVTPSTTPSGIMDWIWSLPGAILSVVTGSPAAASSLPLTHEQIQQQQNEETERLRIEGVLSNPQQLAAIKARNQEAPKGRVNALETLYNNKDISLIIEESDLAITEGAPNQVAGIEVEPQPREKRSWGVLGDMYRWLTRTPEDKTRYRKGIIAARKHVWSTYGPAAAKRFDAHFALRHRTGSPLTVRVLKKFLDHEKTLISGDGSNPESHCVAPLSLSDKTTLDQFSMGIADRAKLEFDLRYYIPERNAQGGIIFKRPAGMKDISKEDKAVLFAEFYQNYLQRPVVVGETVSQKIRGEKGITGFFSTRWSALWMSVFPGDNHTANQELDTKLTDWIINQTPATAERLTRKKITDMIHERREGKGRLTLDDVNDLIEEARIVSEESNTWSNFLYYRVLGGLSRLVGAGAVAATAVNSSSLGVGAAKGAALGAALYAMDDTPGLQLSTGLAALWAANHPQATAGAEHNIASTATHLVKNGAIAFAGLHFPPLWLLYLF